MIPQAATPSLDEDALVGALHEYGVRYLSGAASEEFRRHDVGPAVLIAQMARSADPRLRHALAALFLVHPELAPVARDVAAALPAGSREHLKRAYVAAVYLQRLWWTRLQRYLGQSQLLPPLWIDELDLPLPDARFGKEGLAALTRLTPGFARSPRDGRGARLGPYFKASRLLLAQLMAERGSIATPIPIPTEAGA